METTLNNFEKTIGEFINIVSSFDDRQINTVPFAGSWTPGQVARHIIMSNSGFADMLSGSVANTTRDASEFADQIKADFLNFNIKMKSPDFVVPEDTDFKKADLLNDLQHIEQTIQKDIKTMDLSKTCTSFALPVYGNLTRLEAIYFVIYHTQRHIHQLKNIRNTMVN
ncbi:hypothetical protein GCM10023149_11810 [Mucilaginibacter gynuensis]|uniref:DinB-like domain-containing protein n=1 Tax=Mucilaginibacter gynuensis TaxID=1302236 RepID=A0ABP8G175_9SPHI